MALFGSTSTWNWVAGVGEVALDVDQVRHRLELGQHGVGGVGDVGACSAPLTMTLIELLPVMLSWATWIGPAVLLQRGKPSRELLLFGVEVGGVVQADDDHGRALAAPPLNAAERAESPVSTRSARSSRSG